MVIPVETSSASFLDPALAASDVEDAGLDLVWLQGDPSPASSPADTLTTAAFVAPRTSAVRIVTQVPVGPHPLHIAEQAVVVDNVSSGRLVLVLAQRHDGDAPLAEATEALLAETTEVVLSATSPAPFQHRGDRWTIPGDLEANTSERRVSVTPNPAQLELPIWLSGPAAVEVGCRFGLSHVATSRDGVDQATVAWGRTEDALGQVVVRMRRPAIRDLICDSGGDFDDEALVSALAAESSSWGLDVAALRVPARLERTAYRHAARRLASLVRPQFQMDRIPDHVQRYWQAELTPRPARWGAPP
jgi:alkanesulfonate monooxygenase SsuD/methylene tetrahydromethanopterin reductase-like flavin-dependent oxidoreductase (luciferase family)